MSDQSNTYVKYDDLFNGCVIRTVVSVHGIPAGVSRVVRKHHAGELSAAMITTVGGESIFLQDVADDEGRIYGFELLEGITRTPPPPMSALAVEDAATSRLMAFSRELEALINSHGIDAELNVPDFAIRDLLMHQITGLKDFAEVCRLHGSSSSFVLKPGMGKVAVPQTVAKPQASQ